MTFTSTQKVIKIGSSSGITLPAKELKRLGVTPGGTVKVTVERADDDKQILQDYKNFTKQYGETLKNLSDR